MTGIKRIHYCDDFKFDFKRVDVDGNAVAVPTHQWQAVIHTPATEFRAWQDDKGIVGAKLIDEYTIRFILNAHGLQPGAVVVEFVEHIPDEDFPDGSRRVHRTYNTGIELVADSEASAPDGPVVTLMLPYIYETAYTAAVSAGYKGTKEEYMALASMLPNAVETAIKIQGSADSLADSAERIGSAIETLGATTENIEQGANVIKDNADTLQESATIVRTSAKQIGGNIADLQASVLSIDATKQAFEMLSSEWADGRQAIATALTNRRYPTDPTESFHAMAEKITNMSYEEGWFAKIGYTDENNGGIQEAIDYSYELAKGWNPDGSTFNLFRNDRYMRFLPQLDTSNVTNMSNMFYDCTALSTIPQLDTSNVTTMASMFAGCRALSTIPPLDTSNVTTMAGMFNMCIVLSTIPPLDTSNVTNMSTVFYGCTALSTISHFDISKVTGMSNMFYGCSSVTFALFVNLGKSNLNTFPFEGLSNWGFGKEDKRQSLIDSLITYSYDRASNGMPTATIKLSANTKALLTEEEIAQITAKGFTIA